MFQPATVAGAATEMLQMVVDKALTLGVQPCDLVAALSKVTPKRRGRPPTEKASPSTKRRYTNGRPKVPFGQVEDGEIVEGVDGRLWMVAEVGTKKAGVMKKTWKLVRDGTGRPMTVSPEPTEVDEIASKHCETFTALDELAHNYGSDADEPPQYTYETECVGAEFGCPEKTNGSQFCSKTWCPYWDEAMAANSSDGSVLSDESAPSTPIDRDYNDAALDLAATNSKKELAASEPEVFIGMPGEHLVEVTETKTKAFYQSHNSDWKAGWSGAARCPVVTETPSPTFSTTEAANILAGFGSAAFAPDAAPRPNNGHFALVKKSKRDYKTNRPNTPPKELQIGATEKDVTGRTWIVSERATRSGGKCNVWKLNPQ